MPKLEYCQWGEHDVDAVAVWGFEGSDKKITICQECFNKSLVFSVFSTATGFGFEPSSFVEHDD